MKRLFHGIVASLFVLAATPAFAGAVGGALEPVDWSGPYFGISAGGGWGTSETHDQLPGTTGDFDLHGGVVGLTGGYNWQLESVVLGIEADASLSTIKGSTTTFCSECSTDLRWLGTLRGRVGYPMGKFLPYVTGGLAVGDVKASVLGWTEETKTRVGWTAGAGLAYGFTTGFSVKAEYLYTDLGHVDYDYSFYRLKNKASDFQIVRVGLNFGF